MAGIQGGERNGEGSKRAKKIKKNKKKKGEELEIEAPFVKSIRKRIT